MANRGAVTAKDSGEKRLSMGGRVYLVKSHTLPYILHRKYVLGYDATWLSLIRPKAMADR